MERSCKELDIDLTICGVTRCDREAKHTCSAEVTLAAHGGWVSAVAAVPLCDEHLAEVKRVIGEGEYAYEPERVR